MISEYIYILVPVIIGLIVGIILISSSYVGLRSVKDNEKLSAYECGFNPYSHKRSMFDIKFYLVSILFIIFDIEIMFIFPWALCLKIIGIMGFISMMFFLLILTVGFIYEWYKGALEW